MRFKIGTKVTVIDEELSGVVLSSDESWVEFVCEDGFTYRYPTTSLYGLSEEDEIEFTPTEFSMEMKEEDQPKRHLGLRPINFDKAKTSFDLHLEELMPSRMPGKSDVALQIQLDYAAAVMNKAIQLKIRQLVFIHGMGQGVLRDELRVMLSTKFPNAEFFDGNYQKYGMGATEVIIHGLGSL